MSRIQQYKFRRLKLVGGQVTPIDIQQNDVNVLRFVNWGTSELRISTASDPENYPMAIATGNGGTNNLMDPVGIGRVFVYAEISGEFGLIEMQIEDPMLILAMESVVANLMTSLPAGTAHVGSVGIDFDGGPAGAARPLPVQVNQVDVGDRAGRDLGKARLMDNAGALYSFTNPQPVRPGAGVKPVKITFAGAETQVVKGAPGRVLAVTAVGCDVTLADDAAEIWFVPAGQTVVFGSRPAECATSIQLTSSEAGTAYVQHE